MKPLLLTGLSNAVAAFKVSSEPLSVEARAALDAAGALAGTREELTFRKPGARKATDALKTVDRLKKSLAEHGHNLEPAQVAQVVERLDAEQTKRRFWVQTGISAAVLLFCLLILGIGKPTADMQKGLFGLLGTIVGYWLR